MFNLFFTFFKIGLFTFGGGYAMISQIKEQVVNKYKWLTEDELLEVIAIAESTPGPIAINLATYVGYKRKKFLGSVFSTLGVILPSMIIIYIISLFLDVFLANKYIAYAFYGIKCAVCFLIIKAAIEMFINIPKRPISLILFLFTFIALILLNVFSVNFSSIILIVLGGLIGLALYSKKEEGK